MKKAALFLALTVVLGIQVAADATHRYNNGVHWAKANVTFIDNIPVTHSDWDTALATAIATWNNDLENLELAEQDGAGNDPCTYAVKAVRVCVVNKTNVGWAGLAQYYYNPSNKHFTKGRIQLNDARTPAGVEEAVTVHEIGHFLDHQALGSPGRFASGQDQGLLPWRHAVRASSAFRELKALELAQASRGRVALGNSGLPEVRLAVIRYLLGFEELWARSYAQYVATRSGDQTLLHDLGERRRRSEGSILYHAQWEDTDFAPIGEEIDRLFRRLTWLG